MCTLKCRIIILAVMNIVQISNEYFSWQLAAVLSSIGDPTSLCIMGAHILFNLKEEAEKSSVHASLPAEGGSATLDIHQMNTLKFSPPTAFGDSTSA